MRAIAVIANQPAYYRQIFLLHVTAIVLLVGTRADEDNPFPPSIGVKIAACSSASLTEA